MYESFRTGIALVVFCLKFCWYFYAAVTDEVVNHFQPVEECFFAERLATEVEPYLVENS